MRNLMPILLVEDDRTDAMIFKRAFEDLKISNPLVCLADCKRALTYLREGNNARPQIILTDLNTLRMNAVEFLKVIKSDKVLKRIPVIMLTGSGDENDVTECFKLGVVGYMVKPNDYQKLVEMVSTILEYWTLNKLSGSSLDYRVDSFASPRVVVKQ
jgi:CheY-like chemotaxis protein